MASFKGKRGVTSSSLTYTMAILLVLSATYMAESLLASPYRPSDRNLLLDSANDTADNSSSQSKLTENQSNSANQTGEPSSNITNTTEDTLHESIPEPTENFENITYAKPSNLVQGETVKYTASSETHCIGGTCTALLYSAPNFIQDRRGNWRRIGEITSITYSNNLLKISWNDRSIILQPYVVYNGTYIDKSPQEYKFSVSYANYLDYIKLKPRIKFASELTEFGFKKVSWSNDEVVLNFDDLLENNFDVSENETHISIKNLAGKVSEGEMLLLDPVITLNGTNLGVVGDALVNQAQTGYNYGANTTLQVQTRTSSRNMRTFLLFNLSVVPAGATITDATLALYLYTAPTLSRTYNAYNTSLTYSNGSAWIEGTKTGATGTLNEITWSNQPSAGTLQQGISTGTTNNVWLNWNVTNAAVSSFAQTNQNMSILIQDSAESATQRFANFRSDEYTTNPSQRPVLNVTYSTFYQSLPNLCGYNTTTVTECGSGTSNTFCTAHNYYPTQSCSAAPTYSSCQAESSSGSCAVCGDCAGGADTCGTAACGTTYGCASGICDGLGTGAGHCLATFATGAACNCSQQCTSGVCTGNLCVGYYANTTSNCGYYFGTSSSCPSNPITNCDSSHYFPTTSCTTTTSAPSCSAVSSSAACATCGNCSSNSCNAAACGTTNNYGCANVCSGQGTGAPNCAAPGGTGATCYCNAMCTSGVCSGGTCQPYIQSGTNLCGYYNGTSASCDVANTFCAAGNYFPTQACSATPTYTACQTADTTHYCAVCGDCAGGSDTCGAATCGSTYGCAGGNVCNGVGTGAGNCVAPGGNGTTCYCDQMCTSGYICASNLCKGNIVGFTITLPGQIAVTAAEGGNPTSNMEFNLTGGNTASNVDPCVTGGGTCQSSGTPIFVFTNTGTATLNWYIYLDTAIPASMTLKGDTDSNPLGATTITTTGWNVANSIAAGGSSSAWLWTDFTGAKVSDATNRTLKNNATST